MLHLTLLLVAAVTGLDTGTHRRQMRRLTFRFYNLAPVGERGPRDAELVRRELHALANRPIGKPWHWWRRRPKVIGVCEAVGRTLPSLGGYRLIRSRLTGGRANVALYVLEWLDVDDISWVDLHVEWPRPKDPSRMHEARSILVVVVRGWTVIVGHAPQEPSRFFTAAVNRGLAAGRLEWSRATVRLMNRRGPVTALTDPNALGARLVRLVGRLISESVVTGGTTVEAVHGLKVTLRDVLTPSAFYGVLMRSDHGRALMGVAERRG